MKKSHLYSRGFTLVEILVVIAIIGVLSLVVFASINQARANARDKDRLGQLKQLQAAIEVYGHTNGRYPLAGCGRGTSWTGHGSSYGGCAVYIAGIEDLISPLPEDPINKTQGYLYRTNANGTAYKLLSYNALENQTLDASSEYARYRTGDNCGGTMTGAQIKTLSLFGGAEAACW